MNELTCRIGGIASFVVAVLCCCAATIALAGCRSDDAPATTAAPAASSAAAVAQAVAAGKTPLEPDGTMRFGAEDRCPVCAMRVADHPEFASAIQRRDGTTFYFCGTGCMLRAWLHPETFLGSPRSELERGVVQEYFTGQVRNAADVVWVAGSDVVGPMGPALVPLADEVSVEKFRQRHGGKATFELAELDDGLWQQLTGKKAGR